MCIYMYICECIRVCVLVLSSMLSFRGLCRVGLVHVVSVSAFHMVGLGFASQPGHAKDHHKNGTNCLPAWHAMR